jgi:two-component sensor histidine kinase/sensor domain CHASE-containing protein
MRKRILLAIGATLLVMLIIISLASRSILNNSYASLENRYAGRNIQRVSAEIDRQADSLGVTAADYGTWTEMYSFAQHPTREFAEENFSDAAGGNLHLSVVLVANREGSIIFARTLNKADGEQLGEHLAWWLASHPWMARFADAQGRSQGIVTLPEGIFVVASRPILDSQGTRPVGGAIIMGQHLDEESIATMSSRLMISIHATPLSAATDAGSAEALRHITASAPMYLDTRNRDTLSAYAVLNDVEKTPSVLVRVDSPRDIYRQGQWTLSYFYFWLLFIGVAFCAVVLLTVELTVLSRLFKLSKGVLAIGTGGDTVRRLAIAGRDQIAYLGAAINGMLDAQARSTEDLRASERRSEAFLDAVPDVIFRVTRDGTILDARSPQKLPLLETANNLVGKDAEQVLYLYSFLSPTLFDTSLAAVETALNSGAPQIINFHADVETGRRYYEERIVASGDNEAIVLVREVTDRTLAEEARRKETLLKEIHHRVKNNLQVISSLLALQAAATPDETTRALLTESRDRVRSMALIHEKLYEKGDERGVSFAGYVRDLAAHLRHSYTGNSGRISVEIDVEEMSLDMDVSVPCGLIITELLSNSLKYAFPDDRSGTVTVRMRRAAESMLVLSVSDNGVGFPAGMDIHAPATLGLRIVNSLVTQLQGSLKLEEGGGATVVVTFPGG